METNIPKSITMKIFPKGQVVIPVALREKYQIEIGDQIEVVSTSEGILLKPKPKKHSQKTLTRQLFGIFNNYSTLEQRPTDADIEKSTENGFIEGLKE